MAASDPAGLSRSNGGSPAPTTPRGQASRQINIIVDSIAQEFGLPLRPRVGTFSPSKQPDGYPERCVDRINFLFFMNKVAMYDVINSFRKDRAKNRISGDHLESFYTRIRDAAYIEKNKPQVGKLRLDEPVQQPQSDFKKPAPKLSLTQTKLIPKIKKGSKLSRVKPTETEDQNSKTQLLPVNQSFLLDSEPVNRGTKRLSDSDSSDSPPYVRLSKQPRQQRQVTDHSSCKASYQNTSFASSGQTNACSISLGHENQSFATTVATSFDRSSDDLDSSSADHGDLDLTQAEQAQSILKSFMQPSNVQTDSEALTNHGDSFAGRLRLQRPLPAAETCTTAAGVRLQQEHVAASRSSEASFGSKTSSKVLENRLVRSLPTDGLFGTPVAVDVNHSSFHHLWESYRVADTIWQPLQYHANVDDIYQQLPAGTQFQRTSPSVWDALIDPMQSANVKLKANLNFNPSLFADKLLTLSLQPLKCERACILERHFGTSRFLYIEIPQVHRFKASHLSGQEDLLKVRYLEWLCNEKEFLGRTRRAFHVQDVKKKHSKDNVPSQRLVLFAVDGPRLRKVSVDEMVKWAIPLNINGHQGFCKAYARLDLFLSQTIPTVNFGYREVKYVTDTLADGSPESNEYNDRRMKFEYRCATSDEQAVMNDGCSLISVGAAKELCEEHGIKSVRPVAFQGRINGCKGVWMISAPYDTTEPKHRKRWIQMTESQRKVVPRDEDLTNSCKPNRSPKPSTLNLGFIPILQNRHVSRDTLQHAIETQLEMDFSAFLDSLKDPVSLRRWLHAEFSGMEEMNRKLGIREAGNFPSD
ncbi:hypothetical protein E4T38_09113 [Aureobasidium subglaciale]|nr:hypothetical protein E4T38_09113 [Aureobasidium subglaciale]KAI5214427.1 hypothetical protein E4T40_09016 [Aureobasidium subglaciale]KAI5217003.1 hypothetical protein E4T41_09018 [Aureobasidium subglaciale]KAI5254732.1 hypothetical protein E4T46_09052 [Aureobasidium subglaciale]